MAEPNYIVVFVTTNTDDEAQQIARILLENRKAACINMIPEVDSRFWWENQIDSAQESLLVIKTRASLLPEIIELVKVAHSNIVPEIIALPIVGGNPDYLKWIDEEVK